MCGSGEGGGEGVRRGGGEELGVFFVCYGTFS